MSSSLRKRSARTKGSEEKVVEVDENAIDNSFWFHREEDEEFVGNLVTRKAQNNINAAQDYADFLAASTHMSLRSFTGVRGSLNVSKNNIFAIQEGNYMAKEVLPFIEKPLPWGKYLLRHKFVVLAVATAVVSVLFAALFVIPVSQLNNDRLDCEVIDFRAVDLQCEDESSGFCIEQQVETVLKGQQVVFESVFYGFEKENEVFCAINSCEDQVFVPNRNNLPESCVVFLEEQQKTVDQLSDAELVGCSSLTQRSDCVFVSNKSPVSKRWYFFKELEEQDQILVVPKQPSQRTVFFSSVLVFSLLLVYFLFAVVSEVSLKRKLKAKRRKLMNEEVRREIQERERLLKQSEHKPLKKRTYQKLKF